jgi:hypothetical protein
MGQVLHGSARTTEAVRRALQRSEESVRSLAKRYGIGSRPRGPVEMRQWSFGTARFGLAVGCGAGNVGMLVAEHWLVRVARAHACLQVRAGALPAGYGRWVLNP